MQNETIDTSQWLPRGYPIITPERLAKGDLQPYATVSARVIDTSLLTGLISEGFLEPWHESYITTLLELQNARFSALRGRISSIYIGNATFALSRVTASEMYDHILGEIGLDNVRVIEKMFILPNNQKHISATDAYMRIVNALVRATDEARKIYLDNDGEKAQTPNVPRFRAPKFCKPAHID